MAATLAAALAPVAVFKLVLLATGVRGVPIGALSLAFVVSLAHAVALGLPAAGLLLWLGLFRFKAMLSCGFAAGCLPMAYLYWSPSFPGWPEYLQGVLCAGGLGAVGSTAFYFTFKRIGAAGATESKLLRAPA